MRQAQSPKPQIRCRIGYSSEHKLNGLYQLMNHNISKLEAAVAIFVVEDLHKILFICVWAIEAIDGCVCLLIVFKSRAAWREIADGCHLYISCIIWICLFLRTVLYLGEFEISTIHLFFPEIIIMLLLQDEWFGKKHPKWCDQGN